jgi:hypothetical protein
MELVGTNQVSNAPALPLDAFQFPTLSIAGVEKVFTLAQAVDAVGKSIPAGTNWVVLDMQAKLGSQDDSFIVSLDATSPASISPMVGQSKQYFELKNIAQIANATFIGVPKVLTNEIVLVAEFWSANPNL